MKLLATVKEAVADAQVEIPQEENAEARPGAPGPRTDQNGSPKQPDIRQQPADLQHAIREFVAWYCSEPRLAFNRIVRAPVSDSPRTARVCTCHDQPSARRGSAVFTVAMGYTRLLSEEELRSLVDRAGLEIVAIDRDSTWPNAVLRGRRT